MTTPRFRIPAHVVSFSSWLIGGTAIAFGAVKLFGKEEQQKEDEIRAKYGHRVTESQNQRKEMQAFFDKMKKSQQSQGKDKGHDDAFNDILKGGKGKIKRYSRNREAVEAENERKAKEVEADKNKDQNKKK